MFYLKDTKKTRTAIEAIVSFCGKKYKYATGESVDPNGWKNHSAKYTKQFPAGKSINARLDKIKIAVENTVEYYRNNTFQPQNKEFRDRVNSYLQLKQNGSKIAFIDYIDVFLNQKDYAPSTKKKYITAKNKLEEYQKKTGTVLYFENFDIDFYYKFKKWFNQLINPKTGIGYSSNFFGSIIKSIKKVLRFSLENGLHFNDKFRHSEFISISEPSQSVYLSTDELKQIYALKFTGENVLTLMKKERSQNIERKILALEKVRDRFLIGAFTALRISDYNRLADYHFEGKFLKIFTLKTKNPIVVPVHPIVQDIINKGGLDYKISEQKINKHIKEICCLAGITEKVTTSRTHSGQTIETTVKKYELITSHTARRSAATNMFKAGIPSIRIMKITGHKTEKSFMKYIKITAEENAEVLVDHPYFNE